MKTVVTKGIVLARTNFQEADRIVTLLTPDQGKVRVLAKGVRKPKSKLAGGIELFSVSDITYLPGRGELATLISSRVMIHYGNIVKDINRTMYGYEQLKRFNKLTEDEVEPDYFELLQAGLDSLNNSEISFDLTDLWLSMQLLRLTGQAPNLRTDITNTKLTEGQNYVFSFDDMAFAAAPDGGSNAKVIKVLRLAHSAASPGVLLQVTGADKLIGEAVQLARSMAKLYLPT